MSKDKSNQLIQLLLSRLMFWTLRTLRAGVALGTLRTLRAGVALGTGVTLGAR